jgi:hypothetical protein
LIIVGLGAYVVFLFSTFVKKLDPVSLFFIPPKLRAGEVLGVDAILSNNPIFAVLFPNKPVLLVAKSPPFEIFNPLGLMFADSPPAFLV